MDINHFYMTNSVDPDFDEKSYASIYPKTKDFYQPFCRENGIDEKRRLFFHFSCYGGGNGPRTVALKVTGGLSERLRVMNSFLSFARATKSIFKVCWPSGRFLDSFMPVPDIEFISDSDFESLRSHLMNLDYKVAKNEHGSYDFYMPKERVLEVFKYAGFTYEGDSTLESMLPEINNKNSIDHLVPGARVLNLLGGLEGLGGCLGVRIGKESEPMSESDRMSFCGAIDKEISSCPEKKIFLSAVRRQTHELFCDMYPGRVINKDGLNDEAAELFALGRTSKIIGSKKCGLSELASLMGGVPLEAVGGVKDRGCILVVGYVKGWQMPACTEKQAYFNHSNLIGGCSGDNLYVAFPWASLIDHLSQHDDHNFDSIDYVMDSLTESFDVDRIRSHNTHTVCQHIFWERLLPFWEHLGIKNVHVSHLKGEHRDTKVIVRPWHLVASNFENVALSADLVFRPAKSKRTLCSFIGAHNQQYSKHNGGSDLRLRLRDIVWGREGCLYELGDSWFLNDVVYGGQMRGKPFDAGKLKTGASAYNRVLSDSLFSLCPEGTGPNTIRIWESMSVGTIPVLFKSDWVRPQLDGFEWDDVSLTVPEGEEDNLLSVLKGVEIGKIEQMQMNCVNAYNRLRTRTCF